MDCYRDMDEAIKKRLAAEMEDLKENNEWMAKRIIKLEGDLAQARLSERTFDKQLGWKSVH